MNLIFRGTIPPKKNSKIISFKSKRLFPSKRYTEWHKRTLTEVFLQARTQRKHPSNGAKIKFYMPDKRRRDMTNIAESIMDLLVDAKIIEDDCWQVINEIVLIACGVDKENPRAEVELYECNSVQN